MGFVPESRWDSRPGQGGCWWTIDVHRVINSCAWQVPDMPLSWASHGFDAQNVTAPLMVDGSMVETFGQWFPFREPRSGFCPKARGYAVCGVTPGMGGRCITTPKVVVPGDRTGALTRSGCGVVMQINRARCPFGPIEPPPANLPGFYDGTTLPGLFGCPPFTHGSTSAVQPGALWQNPVGNSRPGQGVLLVDW